MPLHVNTYSYWNFITTYNCFFGHAATIPDNHWIHSTNKQFHALRNPV